MEIFVKLFFIHTKEKRNIQCIYETPGEELGKYAVGHKNRMVNVVASLDHAHGRNRKIERELGIFIVCGKGEKGA